MHEPILELESKCVTTPLFQLGRTIKNRGKSVFDNNLNTTA